MKIYFNLSRIVFIIFTTLTACNEPVFQALEGGAYGSNECPLKTIQVTEAGNEMLNIQISEGIAPKMKLCINKDALQNLSPPTTFSKIELMFVIDTTGSMQQEINQVKNNLRSLASQLKTLAPSARIGVALFQDSALEGGTGKYSSYAGDYIYQLKQPLTSDVNQVVNALTTITANGGGDLNEVMTEAIFQVSTGEGLKRGAITEVAPSDAGWTFSNTESIARYVVIVSDAPTKELTFGHTQQQALDAAKAKGILVMGIGGSLAMDSIRTFATGTGMLAHSAVFDLREGDPFVFEMNSYGNLAGGNSTQPIADAISEAVRQTLPFQLMITAIEDKKRLETVMPMELSVPASQNTDFCVNLSAAKLSSLCEAFSNIQIGVTEKTNRSTIRADFLTVEMTK